ncbi:hypothetical protein [Sporisorium scitamineum]|uniref:DUF1168 domain protein n=1 Tax=Sporisorium scitamineum TaxID=49012 RepID=A0A0F7RX54_9BASI|nr:hypothetical protein [Sporisorium scitamineum]
MDSVGSAASGKKVKLSAHERQAQAISKLLANPDKEIRIPDGPKEKSIRPPRDVMKNVTGSSAGAGSGEFHVYKQQRRREYERIQLMEEQNQKLKEKEEFDRKRAEVQHKDEAKTDKNRAKRTGEPDAKKPRLHNESVQRIEFKPKDESDDDDQEQA